MRISQRSRVLLVLFFLVMATCCGSGLGPQFNDGAWFVGLASVAGLICVLSAMDRGLPPPNRRLWGMVGAAIAVIVALIAVQLPAFRRSDEKFRRTMEAVGQTIGGS
jgi:hypothetical protein